MNERTKTGLDILQSAVLLGILGNILLREVPWGLNVLLFVAAFVAAMAMLVLKRRKELWTTQSAALYGAMIFFAAMFVWRDSIQLRLFDTFAILTILGVLILPAMKINAKTGGAFHYLVGFLWSGVCAAFAAVALFTTDVDWKTMPKTGATKHFLAVVRGLIIALPIVLIFGALFVAADAVYQGMIERIFNAPAETVFTHVLLTSIFAWLTAGYFRGALFETAREQRSEAAVETRAETNNLSIVENIRAEETVNPDALPDNATILEHINKEVEAKTDEKPPQPEKQNWTWQNLDNSLIPQVFTLGVVEMTIVLGLINLLFLSFVIVQIPYLFGGMELVQMTPDFKLAEYARRGFGELVAVAGLVLPILLVSHWLLRKDKPANEKIYRIFAGIQIALLFVIMASAVQRLVLLTGNLGYGLTTVRLYPMIFMIWLAVVFIWFGLTVLRGARQYFAWGALWAAFAVLGATHVLNPDEFIVRTNVRLMQEGREFDVYYNTLLSQDATTALMESYDFMSKDDQCVVKDRMRREAQAETQDFRTWNWSRARAREAAAEKLETVGPRLNGCPAPIGRPYIP